MNLISEYKSNHYKMLAIKWGMRIDQVENHDAVGLDPMTHLPAVFWAAQTSSLLAASQTHHACFCHRTFALTIPFPGILSQSYLFGLTPFIWVSAQRLLIRKSIHGHPFKTVLCTDSYTIDYPHTHSTYYGLNVWVLSNLYVEVLMPRWLFLEMGFLKK